MKYNYNSELDCFVREDGLGKKIWITSTEAHRIMTMYDLGNSIGEIRNKINFAKPKRVTESTIKNFINNVADGNIVLDDNLPAPDIVYTELSLDEKVNNLEERLNTLESMIDNHESRFKELKSDCWISAYATKSNKISWRERLGL